MRLIYWLDYKFQGAYVALGDWAWKGPWRPVIVWIIASVIMASLVGGMLAVLDAIFRS